MNRRIKAIRVDSRSRSGTIIGLMKDFHFNRIELGEGIFILAILITFTVALLTVGFRSVKAALMDPTKTLRTE